LECGHLSEVSQDQRAGTSAKKEQAMTPEQLRELPIGTLLYEVNADDSDSPRLDLSVIGTILQVKNNEYERVPAVINLDTTAIENDSLHAKTRLVRADADDLHCYKTSPREAAEDWISWSAQESKGLARGIEKALELWCQQ
jgi:hypothetical protein